ncbi:hypothetical protein [Legionella nagasakiensis]|uniref:hypothetical protein n=1 Tax=Legionella nagasakiensis TaxID=535290 RepID=UPI001054FEDE|nr:hypothetical protein [Legionella nagasakiensis]
MRNQAKFLLENPWHAALCAVVLALLPYTSWLSVALIALVTLRKGSREGGLMYMAVLLAHCSLSLTTLTAKLALINTLLIFTPCYLAAILLRTTASWRAVAGGFFLQVLIVMMLLQTMLPDFSMAQFLYFKAALRDLHYDNALLEFVNSSHGAKDLMLANYLLGIQAAGIVLSATLSLMLARSLQSQLYYPGGFRKEMLDFRSEKLGLFLLVIMMFAASHNNILAINILPVLIAYFLLSGLSLGFNLFAKKRLLGSFLLLITPLLLMPLVMLPIYVVLGSLDSLFNFRLYLPRSYS